MSLPYFIMERKFDTKNYFSITSLYKYDMPFNFVIGGRGTGKTYGALLDMLESEKKFMFMRRSQTQLKEVCEEKSFQMEDESTVRVSLSPFKSIERNTGMSVTIEKISKDLYAFFYNNKHIGYGCSLNTISNIRGFDASDIDYLIFDEFVPLPGEMSKKDEGRMLMDAYETINRNRELEGRKPLYMYCLANANDIDCPILLDLELTEAVEKMINKEKRFRLDGKRRYTFSLLENSEFDEAKSQTAIYHFTRGLKYNEMAFQNKFAYDDFTNISSRNIKEYTPLWNIGNYYIYNHKSRPEYYISMCAMKTKESYPDSEFGFEQFRLNHGREMYGAYMENRIIFETYRSKKLLTDLVA